MGSKVFAEGKRHHQTGSPVRLYVVQLQVVKLEAVGGSRIVVSSKYSESGKSFHI